MIAIVIMSDGQDDMPSPHGRYPVFCVLNRGLMRVISGGWRPDIMQLATVRILHLGGLETVGVGVGINHASKALCQTSEFYHHQYAIGCGEPCKMQNAFIQ